MWLGVLELGDLRMFEINSPELPILVVATNWIEDHEGRVGNDLVSL